jgi:hypothetical protein
VSLVATSSTLRRGWQRHLMPPPTQPLVLGSCCQAAQGAPWLCTRAPGRLQGQPSSLRPLCRCLVDECTTIRVQGQSAVHFWRIRRAQGSSTPNTQHSQCQAFGTGAALQDVNKLQTEQAPACCPFALALSASGAILICHTFRGSMHRTHAVCSMCSASSCAMRAQTSSQWAA